MRYAPFGKEEFQVSRLGFGMMRLPRIRDGEKEMIDRAEAIRMVRAAVDGGVNYVDTAYGYHNGESEIVTGLALKDGYRGKVRLTTKLPVWLVETRQDMDRLLDEQLKKLDVPYLDYYLLHALDGERFEKMKALEVLAFLDAAKKDGRIRHAGFSFHGRYPAFKKILDAYDWDLAQVQFNYLDTHTQAGRNGVLYAGRKHVPVVVMEPLRGGSLVTPPSEVRGLMDRYPEKRSPVEWAFRFVGSFPEVATVLSGMSTMDQVRDNLRIFSDIGPGCAGEKEAEFFKRLRLAYLRRMPIGCTGCAYCIPCPQEVRIPQIFREYNSSRMFNEPEDFRETYARFIKNGHDASRCIECHACESKCPQKLEIVKWLKTIREGYESGK